MPRRTLQINDFSKGQNNALDPEDLADNELAICKGADTSTVGLIRTGPFTKNAVLIDTDVHAIASPEIAPNPGWGLFQFSSDAETMEPTGVYQLNPTGDADGEGGTAEFNSGCDNMPNYPPEGSGTGGAVYMYNARSEYLIPDEKNRKINASSPDWVSMGSPGTYTEDTSTDEALEITPDDVNVDQGAELGVSQIDGGYGGLKADGSGCVINPTPTNGQYYILTFDAWRDTSGTDENANMVVQFCGTEENTFTITEHRQQFKFRKKCTSNSAIKIYQKGNGNGDTVKFYLTNFDLKTGGEGAVIAALVPGGNDKVPTEDVNPNGLLKDLGVTCPGHGYSDKENLLCLNENTTFDGHSSTGTAGTGFFVSVDKTFMWTGALEQTGQEYLLFQDTGSDSGEGYQASVDMKVRLWGNNDGWIYRKWYNESKNGSAPDRGGWSTDDRWYVDFGSLTAGKGGAKFVYYNFDGIIRICNGNWGSINYERDDDDKDGKGWFGYIKRPRYLYHGSIGNNIEHNIDFWDQGGWTDAKTDVPLGPQEGKAFLNKAGWGIVGSAMDVHLDLATLTASEEGTHGSGHGWGGKKWQLAYSYVYDYTQETPLYECPEVLDMSNTATDGHQTTTKAKVVIYIDPSLNSRPNAQWNRRCTGIKAYIREAPGANSDPSTFDNVNPQWCLMADASLYNGIDHEVESGKGRWQGTQSELTDLQWWCHTEYMVTPPSLRTYESETGYDSDMHFKGLSAEYKCATVANRRVWIGNVRYHDKAGNKITRGDAVIGSPVNRPDSFPEKNIIEGAVNDGDRVVALESFADRLMIFKTKRLELLNISQADEFLEDTKDFMGVVQPSAVCKTPYGVCFVNKYGLYLYNGQNIHNLMETRQGIPRYDEETWETLIKDTATIGYAPLKKQLIIRPSTSSVDGGFDDRMLVYNFKMDTIIEMDHVVGLNANATNFASLTDGRLVMAYDSYNIHEYDPHPTQIATGDFRVKTKVFNFGDKSVRKKVYKIYITFKCGANDTNVRVRYNKLCEHDHTCGNAGWSEGHTFQNGSNFTSEELYAQTMNEWCIAELKPTTSAIANNIKTFQLDFESTGIVPSSFVISDIQIIYRTKSTK